AGYITAPQTGDSILTDKENPNTRIAAKVSGVDSKTADIQFVVETEFDKITLKASYNEEQGVWEAILKDSALLSLGEAVGTISLYVDGEEIAKITIKFNMEIPVQNDMVPEDFEGYNGDNQQLGFAWATNKASGSEITLLLTDEENKVFGGKYGLKMDMVLAAADAWVGATKSFEADWSAGNALELYTIPETKGQKVVVQVKSSGEEFEVYLQEYEEYTSNAAKEFPVKVTIPFSAFVGKNNGKFDPARIEAIGLWCNALPNENVTYPLSTALYYDELRVVTTDQTTVQIEALAKEGVWIKEIPAQDYTGKAIKPEVQVYDYAKLLTPKIDYTVSYKNNTNAGESAKVIIKGKGNYSEKIEKTFTINPKQLDQNSITYPEYLAFNNKQQKINVTVKDGNKKLSSKKDYTQIITYKDTEVTKAKDAGTYQIQITGKGNYTGEIILNCEMVTDKELLSKASVRLPSSSLDYSDAETGAVFDETKIQVKLAGKVIPQTEADGTVNYTVGYENNKEPGASAAVVIKAGTDSKYVGSCRKSFKIKGVAFTAKTIDITGLEATVDYAGKAIFQNPVLKDKTDNKELERNVDYSIAYKNNLNAGKATITFTGLGKYSGTIKKTYKISKVTLTKDMIDSSTIEAEQSRAGAAPDVTITCKGMTLVRDRDYTLTYVNNKNITTDQKKAYISITGKGNYTGKLKNAVELQIHPKSWQSDDITIEVPDMKYSNKKKDYKPNPVVYDNGAKLVKGKDYTITYESNTKDDVGDLTQNPNGHIAKAIITVISSDYEDKDNAENNKRTENFRIIGKLISEAKVKIKNVQYFSQKGTRPTKEDLTVTYKGASVSDDEYDIMSYSANDKKGKATLVIQGKGQYGGTKKITFTIKARGMESNFADAVKKLISTMIEQL
ncbi:MAG: hypothetical protein K2M91_15800, partial [Lachnospiraceae bacterium]|nr:hypothetical protein [Lachnospiraceae bacterium]